MSDEGLRRDRHRTLRPRSRRAAADDAEVSGTRTTLTGPGLDPRGATSIGGGILVGSGLINGPTATHPNKAMIV